MNGVLVVMLLFAALVYVAAWLTSERKHKREWIK